MDEPNMLHDIGVEGTKGLLHIDIYSMPYGLAYYKPFVKFYTAWNEQSKKWKAPYNTHLFRHGTGSLGLYGQSIYWLLSVMERAKTTNPEKIISVWESDTYRFANGKIVRMRACDHKMVGPVAVSEYVEPAKQKVSMIIPPYYWFQGQSADGPGWLVPGDKVAPWMDPKLDRCKGKSDTGL